MRIRAFDLADTDAVVALWRACGLTRPWNDPRKDIERKLTVQPELFRVGELDDAVVATAMAGYDGHRGSVYYLAVAPSHQGLGLGRQILDDVAQHLLALGCPKVNLEVRPGNEKILPFYERAGYEVYGSINLGRRLIWDEPQA